MNTDVHYVRSAVHHLLCAVPMVDVKVNNSNLGIKGEGRGVEEELVVGILPELRLMLEKAYRCNNVAVVIMRDISVTWAASPAGAGAADQETV
jgi:hypothetical protein